ncbi:MAG: dihydrolipoamide acetyltransferase family protein [Planctomycetota bacterium]
MSEFRMPSLGADMDEGKLVEWRVRAGDEVHRGDLIAVVETSKAAVEVEVWEDGVIEELCVAPGTVVPVGGVLARLRGKDEPAGSAPAVTPAAAAPAPVATPAGREAAPAAAPAVGRALEPVARGGRVSPRARRRAVELGIDLSRVQGTGPGGSVTGEDVERAAGAAALVPKPAAPTQTAAPTPAAAAPAPGAPGRATPAPAGSMRQAIAQAMARSKREIPHYYLGVELDVTDALTWLEARNERVPITERALFTCLLIKAVARAAREHPDLNGFYRDGAFQPAPAAQVGVAVALRQGGLVAPALHDAERRSLSEVARALRDLVTRARAGTLRGAELSDPTLTLTHLGERGVDEVYGVIQPPQVALIGAGRARELPRVVAGAVVPRSVLTLTLSADHRVSDGHTGARFLARIGELLGDPEAL